MCYLLLRNERERERQKVEFSRRRFSSSSDAFSNDVEKNKMRSVVPLIRAKLAELEAEVQRVAELDQNEVNELKAGLQITIDSALATDIFSPPQRSLDIIESLIALERRKILKRRKKQKRLRPECIFACQ